jgi:hypothetical protein
MLLTLIVLSTAPIKNETPQTKRPIMQCLNPVKGSTKLEPTNDNGTEKCIAVPDTSKPERKVRK